MPAAYDVYTEQLRELRRGLALYYPEPSPDDGAVEIGDVGYTKQGAFYRLFNVSLPANDPAQSLGVPEGFQPLDIGRIRHFEAALEPGPLHSKTVSRVGANMASPGAALSTDASFQFSCTSSRGAILVLETQMTRDQAVHDSLFKNYLVQHCLSWYGFARDVGIEVDFGDIMLVTECSKTGAWASAVYTQNVKKFSMSFSTGGTFLPSPGEVTVTAGHEQTGPVEKRRSQSRPSGINDGHGLPNNHTVFIKAYCLGPRSLYLRSFARKIMKTMSQTLQGNRGHGDSQVSSSSSGNEPSTNPNISSLATGQSSGGGLSDLVDSFHDVETLTTEWPDYHPVTALLAHIMETSDVEIAVVHDNDWCFTNTLQTNEIIQQFSDGFFNKEYEKNPCESMTTSEAAVVQLTQRMNLNEADPESLLIGASETNQAWTYWDQGQWEEAGEQFAQVVEMRKRVLGEEHPDTLTAMANLASTYQTQGHWKEAEKLEVQVLEMRNRVLGEEHPDTLIAIGNLASTYQSQGHWKEAEELKVHVLEMRKRVLGQEHPDTLIAIGNLASTYRNQGHWKEAKELEVHVLEMRKRVLGEEHPHTLIAFGNLASTYQNQGHWKEAEELEVQVMEMRKRALGEEHPDTLRAMGNLASTYHHQECWKEAEKLEVQVMEMRKRVLGEEHPDTLIAIGNLASTYRNQGHWKEAEKLEVQVLEMRNRVLGEEHPDTLRAMGNLASTYHIQGHWKEAEELEVQVMEMSKRVLGEEHPDTLIAIGNLASTYQNQCHWKEAEELSIQLMEMRKRVLGEEHPDTLIAIGNLASTYRNQGHWKEAEELLIQVMEMSKRVLGEEHPDTLIAIGKLASTYHNQGHWKEAEKLEVQVMEMRKRVLGQEHPDTVTDTQLVDLRSKVLDA